MKTVPPGRLSEIRLWRQTGRAIAKLTSEQSGQWFHFTGATAALRAWLARVNAVTQ